MPNNSYSSMPASPAHGKFTPSQHTRRICLAQRIADRYMTLKIEIMKSAINFSTITYLLFITAIMVLLSCKSSDIVTDNYSPEVIISWNEKIMDLAIEKDGLLTLNGVRTEALANIAVHNALNSIKPVYSFYKYSGSQPKADPISCCLPSSLRSSQNEFSRKRR